MLAGCLGIVAVYTVIFTISGGLLTLAWNFLVASLALSLPLITWKIGFVISFLLWLVSNLLGLNRTSNSK